MCALLTDFFSMQEINCVCFSNESDARTFLRKNSDKFLILLDRKLNGILTDIFAEEIKKMSPFSFIVLITASKKTEINSLLISNIIDKYIEKPFTFDQLFSVVKQFDRDLPNISECGEMKLES